MGVEPPFLYSAERRRETRFPTTAFDPKAVTRASWEPKYTKPKQNGPLISLNRHPDAHMVLPYRLNNVSPLSPRTKSSIKWVRRVQLALRLLELNGAMGTLALMILVTGVEVVTCWILRISAGLSALHCLYAIYHLSRKASGRTPASSAAYQLFAVILDLFIISICGFGAFTAQKKADTWGTILNDQSLMHTFAPAIYYIIVGTGSLQVVSLFISMWLGWMFRKITLMPPDMNPLEDRLTARPFHKRSKSSIATASTVESEKRLSTPPYTRYQPGVSYENVSRSTTTLPFMHTRAQSRQSVASSSPDSHTNLPSRQYQIVPGNSPRNSVHSATAISKSAPRSSYGGRYTELSTQEFKAPTTSPASSQSSQRAAAGRAAKFIETWVPTDSIISRTKQRQQSQNRVPQEQKSRGQVARQPYSAFNQPYTLGELSDSDYEDENSNRNINVESVADLQDSGHPNPLRSNPASDENSRSPWIASPMRHWNNFRLSAYSPLAELSGNQGPSKHGDGITNDLPTLKTVGQHRGDSSIQAEESFYSRPYGDLKGTVSPNVMGENRKISSGNDYNLKNSSNTYGRRHVSGKVVEEGRA